MNAERTKTNSVKRLKVSEETRQTYANRDKRLDSTDPDKRAKLIDTLLATPQFGEQFGRTWGGPWRLGMPAGVAVFPKDAARPIRRWAEKILPTLTQWTEFDRGGHFAAMEQPKLCVSDVRTFARTCVSGWVHVRLPVAVTRGTR